jgi:hypothetical protein
MRVLLGVLLVGIAGCGGEETSPADVATPSSSAVTPVKAENAEAGVAKSKADKPPAQVAVADAVAALKKLRATIKQNEQGEVVEVSLRLSRKITVNGWPIRPRHKPTQITDAGLVHLKGLTTLQELNLLFVTRVTDAGLVHLKGLTNLQELNLSGTKVTDGGLMHLKGLGKLQSLSLPNQITDAGLVHLKRMSKLGTLNLGGTPISDAGLEHLKGLTKLQTLYLGNTLITDSGLVHLKGLTNLQTLNLGGTEISDAGLMHLKGLTNLQSLYIGGFGPLITDAVVADLQKALPNCKISK